MPRVTFQDIGDHRKCRSQVPHVRLRSTTAKVRDLIGHGDGRDGYPRCLFVLEKRLLFQKCIYIYIYYTYSCYLGVVSMLNIKIIISLGKFLIHGKFRWNPNMEAWKMMSFSIGWFWSPMLFFVPVTTMTSHGWFGKEMIYCKYQM